ncbi:hypothetical protein F9K33_06510 [bacterium]|nr:MAG: hypothetical protein F9K33_06510 [bacterium]
MRTVMILFLVVGELLAQDPVRFSSSKNMASVVMIDLGATVVITSGAIILNKKWYTASGIVVGPSVGQFYAHDNRSEITTDAILRLIGAGFYTYEKNQKFNLGRVLSWINVPAKPSTISNIVKGAAIMTIALGTITSISHSSKAVDRYNNRVGVSIDPMIYFGNTGYVLGIKLYY